MSEELMRCPFCGGNATIHIGAGKLKLGRSVGCQNEDCRVNPEVVSNDLASAVKIWNTRP